MNNSNTVRLRDNHLRLRKTQVKRLAHLGGVRSVSKDVVDKTRSVLKEKLTDLIHNSMDYCSFRGDRSPKVSIEDVQWALLDTSWGNDTEFDHGQNLRLCRDPPQGGRYSKGEKSRELVEWYRDENRRNCLVMGASSFSVIVREFSQSYRPNEHNTHRWQDFRFSKHALTLMQYAIEKHIVKLFKWCQDLSEMYNFVIVTGDLFSKVDEFSRGTGKKSRDLRQERHEHVNYRVRSRS